MNIAVLKDSQEDRELLRGYIEDCCGRRRLACMVSTFDRASQFFREFLPGKYDLIFLDVLIPGTQGMEVARRIREADQACALVFCTSSQEYAVESYRVHAWDYLLPPFTQAQFEQVFADYFQLLEKKARFIAVKDGREMVVVKLADILYTDHSNHYIQIHTRNQMIRTYMKFAEFSPRLLSYPGFVNCYRNCIVNMDQVTKLNRDGFTLTNGEIIPVLRAKTQEVKQRYAAHLIRRMEGE